MRSEIADLVNPVFNAGIALRDHLEAGQPLEWDAERNALLRLLATLDPPHAGMAIENSGEPVFDFSAPDDPVERARLTHVTVQFALACWLDEFMGLYSTWGPRWQQEPLSAKLPSRLASPDRFWDEARYAQTRGDMDSLETMYWCAMLGFRGTWRETPELLESWLVRARTALDQYAATWTAPASLALPARDTAMPATRRYRAMFFAGTVGFVMTIPPAAVLLWRIYTA